MAKKDKTHFVCNNCGSIFPKWMGQCSDCGSWNSLEEVLGAPPDGDSKNKNSWTGESSGKILKIKEVKKEDFLRIPLGLPELDRVMGGGLTPGSVTLVGGDPGIGKSTLLLQVISFLSRSEKVLYVSGEESLSQIAMRAERLGVYEEKIDLMSETDVSKIVSKIESNGVSVAIIDSIQTIYHPDLQSSPGSVTQLKESCAQLVKLAKTHNVSLFIVGHVTKEGSLAGPKILEHMVDTVLYFEGEPSDSFRMLRSIKNRFGAAHELGLFSMTEQGLVEVNNPASLFITSHDRPVAGTTILSAVEGNRPFLVEIQALVEDTSLVNPKRFASGIDTNRLQMLLAVLKKQTKISADEHNVYVRVTGGVKLQEPASDLALLFAVYSSLISKPISPKIASFGEVGLTGEIRNVQNAEKRIEEALKFGVEHILVPKGIKIRKKEEFDKKINIIYCSRIEDALKELKNLN